ncbi:MAG: hypothetical protein ACPHCI_09065 [Solirubrobacterales bacterium]
MLTKDNAGDVKAKYVLEGANGPCTAEGDAILELLGDRLGDQHRVELWALDLEDVDLDRLVSQFVQVLA